MGSEMCIRDRISFLSLALLWRNKRELDAEQEAIETPLMAVPVRIRKGRP